MDETMINQALTVLQNQFGQSLRGDMLKGEVAMRHALMQQLQMDESSADKAVKQLAHTGWISFRSGAVPAAADRTVHTGGPAGSRQAGAEGVADAWDDERVTTGNPATDASVRAEPIITGGALSGMQSGSLTAGATGGAYLGAAAAGVAGARTLGDQTLGEAPDPDRNENQISSIDADHSVSDEPGYWHINAPGEPPMLPAN
jgi:hypothetical protein